MGKVCPPRRKTFHQLRQLLASYPDGTIVGEPVVVEEAFDLLEADGKRLNTWCSLLLPWTYRKLSIESAACRKRRLMPALGEDLLYSPRSFYL